MKKFVLLSTTIAIIAFLISCNVSAPTTLPLTLTIFPATPTTSLEFKPMPTKTADNLELTAYPLSAKGPFHIGKQKMSTVDVDRGERKVDITIWYPAEKPPGATGIVASANAMPDTSSAPYPLILSSTTMARDLAMYLVSYGFVWASVDNINTYSKMNTETINQPLDLLFTLNQIVANPPPSMLGMIDSEHVGVIGYSFDGYNTYALSGARIDPTYYLAQCPQPDAITEPFVSNKNMSSFTCDPTPSWDELVDSAGEKIIQSDDGLWQPMSDDRIRAVMPMSGEGWWLFGVKGLAAVNRPVLILSGTQDTLYAENVHIFEQIGTSEKILISFIGIGHIGMIDQEKYIARMAHFATAFFGYHLQGNQNYTRFFSEDFVNEHEDLFWGVYE